MRSPHFLPFLLFFQFLIATAVLAPLPVAAADETATPPPLAWMADFEAICARTPEVMTLSREELQRLVTECDRLQLQIEALPETPRKVYRKRLDMTRKLLIFALQAKTPPPDN